MHVDAVAAIHVDNATPISVGFLGTSHIFKHILFHLVEHGSIASARHVLCLAIDDGHSRVAFLWFHRTSNQYGVVVVVALDGCSTFCRHRIGCRCVFADCLDVNHRENLTNHVHTYGILHRVRYVGGVPHNASHCFGCFHFTTEHILYLTFGKRTGEMTFNHLSLSGQRTEITTDKLAELRFVEVANETKRPCSGIVCAFACYLQYAVVVDVGQVGFQHGAKTWVMAVDRGHERVVEGNVVVEGAVFKCRAPRIHQGGKRLFVFGDATRQIQVSQLQHRFDIALRRTTRHAHILIADGKACTCNLSCKYFG